MDLFEAFDNKNQWCAPGADMRCCKYGLESFVHAQFIVLSGLNQDGDDDDDPKSWKSSGPREGRGNWTEIAGTVGEVFEKDDKEEDTLHGMVRCSFGEGQVWVIIIMDMK